MLGIFENSDELPKTNTMVLASATLGFTGFCKRQENKEFANVEEVKLARCAATN